MGFSDDLWAAGAATYEQILRHPFLTGLTDGSLPRDRFGYFVVQDSHYLDAYARALALVGARADEPDATRMFALHAANAIDVERALHGGLLAELGLDAEAVRQAGAGPVTTAYTSYLTAVCATGTHPEGVAAVLPCYWIYREVGAALQQRSSPDPLYARWIDVYADADFDEVVRSVIAHTDRVGADLGGAERERCLEHYRVTARYEWMFWDAAWRLAQWPV